MQGLEFMVIEDPSENGSKEEHSGTWVIRKQIRKKRYDGGGRQEDDEITPIACYIVMGDTIAMATTVGEVLSNKLVRLPQRYKCPLLIILSGLSYVVAKQISVHDVYASALHALCWPYMVSAYEQTSGRCYQRATRTRQQRWNTSSWLAGT